jgi:hypothetical protein
LIGGKRMPTKDNNMKMAPTFKFTAELWERVARTRRLVQRRLNPKYSLVDEII